MLQSLKVRLAIWVLSVVVAIAMVVGMIIFDHLTQGEFRFRVTFPVMAFALFVLGVAACILWEVPILRWPIRFGSWILNKVQDRWQYQFLVISAGTCAFSAVVLVAVWFFTQGVQPSVKPPVVVTSSEMQDVTDDLLDAEIRFVHPDLVNRTSAVEETDNLDDGGLELTEEADDSVGGAPSEIRFCQGEDLIYCVPMPLPALGPPLRLFEDSSFVRVEVGEITLPDPVPADEEPIPEKQIDEEIEQKPAKPIPARSKQAAPCTPKNCSFSVCPSQDAWMRCKGLK